MRNPFVKWRSLSKYLFSNLSFRQTLAKNAFWLSFGNISGRLARAVFIIYVARILGTEGYGVFSYALSLSALLSLFSDVGVSGILTREAAKDEKNITIYASTALVLKIGLLLLTAGLILLIAPLFAKVAGVVPLIPWAALLVVFDGLRDLTFSVTRAKEKMQTEAWINLATNVMIAAFGIGAVWLHPDAKVLMVSYTVGSGAGMILAYVLLREYFAKFWKHFRSELAWPILAEGIPFALMSLLSTLLTSIDTLIIGWIGTTEQVGLYAAALRPIQLLYMIPSIASTILFPTFARLAAEQGSAFRRVLERSLAFSLLLAIPIAVGGTVLARSIVLLLFGAEYEPAVLSFAILLWTVILSFPYGLIGNAIFAFGKQKNFIVYLAIGAALNVLLDFVLIPRFGIVGSAIATIVAQGISNAMTWRRLKSFQEFSVLPHLKRTALAAIAMGVATWALDRAGVPVIPNIILSAGLYFGALALMKEKLLDYLRPSGLRG